MATHCSIFAWKIPKDRGAWWPCSPWGLKELDTTKHLCGVFFFFFLMMFLTQYDTSIQIPLLIVLPKVSKKVSFLLLRMHQSKSKGGVCFSLEAE